MGSSESIFHLAIPCRDLDEAKGFYVDQLECRLARRYDDRITLEFFGDQVVVAAGIGFPSLAAKMAIHGDVESVTDYRVGLQFRWPVPYALLHALEPRRSWSSL